MGSGNSGLFKGTRGSSKSKIINIQKQNRHIPGSKEFIPGRSELTISVQEAQELINNYSGKGTKLPNGRERIDFGRVIGYYVDYKTGKSYPTTIGIIHFSETGIHIVPGKPNGYKGG